MKSKKVAIVILAAGTASRMGEPKQLLPWNNTFLLGHAIEQALSAIPHEVVVVLGAYAAQIQERIQQYPIRVVVNPDWKDGLGKSLAFGIAAVQETSQIKGALVMLADQPQVQTTYLNQLIQRFNPQDASIIATAYSKGAGVPVLFDQVYFNKLTQLTGDKGAKAVIRQYPQKLQLIHPEEELIDIDTPETYEELVKKLSSTDKAYKKNPLY